MFLHIPYQFKKLPIVFNLIFVGMHETHLHVYIYIYIFFLKHSYILTK